MGLVNDSTILEEYLIFKALIIFLFSLPLSFFKKKIFN